MRHATIATLGLALCVATLGAQLDARQAPPQIHRVSVSPEHGVLVIEGTGLGAHLLATVDGQTVTTLPGGTGHRMEVQAPVSVLTVPGTYRLTLNDPVSRSWEGFIVASAPVAMAGVAPAGVPSNAGPVAGDVRREAGASPATASTSSNGPGPLAVIEDSGSPFRTALGSLALSSNTTGLNNTGIGYHALENVTTAGSNTAVGSQALHISTGSGNTAVGAETLEVNTTGNQNTAVGSQALSDNAIGANNVAVGAFALQTADGDRNIGIGAFAGSGATTGDDNIYIGGLLFGVAGEANTIRIGKPTGGVGGQNRAFIAGIRGTTLSGALDGVYIDAAGQLGSGPVVPANDTVGSGQVIADSLTAADLAANAVGTSEVADNAVTAAKVAFNYAGSIAEGGAASDLACAGCVAAGEVSFAFAGLGANVFQGTQQLGTGNLDLDFSSAAEGNITKRGTRFLHNPGIENTFVGLSSGNFTLTGDDNTGTGDSALVNLTSGARNTAVGSRAGENNTTGSDNIYLGADVIGTASDANTTRIGLPYNAGTGVGQNKVFMAGIAGTVLTTPVVQVFVDASGQLGTIVPSPMITGNSNGPFTPGAVEQRLADQDATIAELRARLARLEALLVARAGRR